MAPLPDTHQVGGASIYICFWFWKGKMKLDTQSALHGLFLEGVRVAVKAGDHTADHSTQVGKNHSKNSFTSSFPWVTRTHWKGKEGRMKCSARSDSISLWELINNPESDPDHFLSFLDAWPVIYAAYHQIQGLLNRSWKFYLRAIYWVCTSESIFYCVAVLMVVWQSPTLVFEPPTVYVSHYYVFFSDDWKDSLSHTL